MTDAASWRAAEDWLWHLFNDPMRENPWSIVALILIVFCGLLGMIWLGWVTDKIGRMMFGRRAKETDMDDKGIAEDAIARALHDDSDEPVAEVGAHRPETLADLPAGNYGPGQPAERPISAPVPLSSYPDGDDPFPPLRAGDITALPEGYHFQAMAAPDDTATRMRASEIRALREPCAHCLGKGYIMTTNDLLRESIALVGDGGDMVIREFYTRLLGAAPDLAALFPPDLLTAAEGEDIDGGWKQRDKLLAALVALSQTYDPADAESMRVLDTHLLAFGRAHAAFQRPDGSVKGATVAEYEAVKQVLFGTLVDAAGPAWRDEYTAAWDEAYEHAARGMIAGQYAVTLERAGDLHPRQPRA